tara:strand:- start:1729 stop:3063 length:1335 start_codon:yes stop_codon:yes gene_type:complete
MAMYDATSAAGNIAIGTKALENVTTGNYNIAIGRQALDNADTESHNIAIGLDALGGAVAGGEYNVAIGNYSLDALTTGFQNTTLGYRTGSAQTTAWGSTLIGFEAGVEAEGSRNTLLGYRAGYYYTGGNDNTAIGYMALAGVYGSSTGSNNNAIGKSALGAVTTGSKNIGIGDSAGDNITTGSNNVVIGAADVASATGDDQLSISSGDGSPVWITGTSDGSVNLPNSILKINGSVGSDGQVLTSTGSAVAWEDAGGGDTSHFDGAKIADINQCYLNCLYPFGDNQESYANHFTSYVQYYQFLAPDSGDVTKLGIRCNNYAGDADVQVGIYSDSNGSPASLLGKVEISIDSASHFDSTQFSSTITLVKGTQYWVGYMVDDHTVNNSLHGSNTAGRAMSYSGQSGGNQAKRVNVRSDNNATSLPSTPSSVSGYWASSIPQVYCVIG